MEEFPQEIDKAINTIAKERKMRMSKDTHSDTSNRVFGWLEQNAQKRIDLTYNGEYVDVTYYKDTFSCCPRLLIWCHNNIPLFPYIADTEWETIDKLPLNQTYDFYDKKLRTYIEYATKR